MNWIYKQWLGVSRKYTLPRNFTKDYYLENLQFWKWNGFIDFHSTAEEGIILRHDIDKDIDKAVRMAEIEAGIDGNQNRALFEHGDHPILKSTYFVLNTRTSGYWGSHEMNDALLYIQNLGHEIGWHNNAITEHLETGKEIHACIRDPLNYLRNLGLRISGSAAHGDRLCKKYRYMNYNVFGFPSKGWDFWDIPALKMEDFGLTYEAYHVPYDGYLADCHEGWNNRHNNSIPNTGSHDGRIQIIIHPQNWRI
jgi:hypothetical protein